MSIEQKPTLKRAFFIIGPEGCGTYMLAESFVAAGCTYCDKDDVDEFLRDGKPSLLVLRRSLPHAGTWPDIGGIAKQLWMYDISFLWIIREQYAAKKSVIARKTRKDGSYIPFEYEGAVKIIGEGLDSFGGRLISYEYFVHSGEYRKNVFSELALMAPIGMEFYDGNAKYY